MNPDNPSFRTEKEDLLIKENIELRARLGKLKVLLKLIVKRLDDEEYPNTIARIEVAIFELSVKTHKGCKK